MGVFESVSKPTLEELLYNLGAETPINLKKSTTHVVKGVRSKSGVDLESQAPYKNAVAQNIPIMTEYELLELVREKVGNKWFTFENGEYWENARCGHVEINGDR